MKPKEKCLLTPYICLMILLWRLEHIQRKRWYIRRRYLVLLFLRIKKTGSDNDFISTIRFSRNTCNFLVLDSRISADFCSRFLDHLSEYRVLADSAIIRSDSVGDRILLPCFWTVNWKPPCWYNLLESKVNLPWQAPEWGNEWLRSFWA